MQFYEAKVADVLRLSQRDEVFLHDVEDQMHSFFKLMGTRSYHRIRKTIPVVASAWYYFMTSLGKLQTLGEEYTGTIRVDEGSGVPSKMTQTLWLILFIGGEPLVERLLNSSKNKISKSTTLTQDAKSFLLKCIDFIKEQRPALTRIHHFIFYVNGKYYNISNRIMGIRYVLLRQWLQDDSFTGSFNFLGNISLFYIIFNYVHQLLTSHTNGNISESVVQSNVSKKNCVLCAENIKSACATSCGHIFCWTCIYDSLSYQKSCPICRENNINPSRIIFLQNYT